jgi:HAD superfamily hydrolase (TIGR01509 family)
MLLPRPVHAVIFDMDGLLCDTETIFRDAMMEVAAQRGHEFPLPLFLSMIGTSDAGSRKLMLDHYGADFPIDAYWADVSINAKARFARGVDLKPGVAEVLDHLDARALPRAICTSSSPAAVQTHLGASGVLPRFHAIVARGDYANGKPHPEPYLTAARKLSVAPENCLALEDSHNGIRSAHGAGMMTVMVPDLLEATAEIRTLCTHVAATLHDVRTLLRPA